MGYQIAHIGESLIQINYFDVFTAEDVVNQQIEVEEIVQSISQKGILVNFLISTSDLKEMSLEGRRFFLQNSNDPRISKVAILGNRRFLRVIVKMLLAVTRKKLVKLFDDADRAKAIAWLESPEPELLNS